MAGSPFTYLFTDLVTADTITELPMTGVTFGSVLNGIGQFSGVVPIADAAVSQMAWNDATAPQRSALLVSLRGQIVWDGIVWARDYTKSGNGIKITGSSTASIFQHRNQHLDHSTTWATAPGGDPLQIAKTIIKEAQDGGIIGGQILGTAANTPPGIPVVIEGGPTPTSDWIVQAYPITQLQKVDSIVTALSQLGYGVGFDYRLVTTLVNGVVTPIIYLGYPRLGLVGSSSGIVFDLSVAVDYEYPEDGTKGASKLTVAATRSGGRQQVAVDPNPVLDGYPLLEDTLSISGLNHNATIQQVADGVLNTSSVPVVVPTVTTYVDGTPPLGSYAVGDDATLTIPPVAGDLTVDPRFPTGMSALWRVTGWTCSVPDDGGNAKIVTTFNLPPAAVPQYPPI